jgi:hypothetical protein
MVSAYSPGLAQVEGVALRYVVLHATPWAPFLEGSWF